MKFLLLAFVSSVLWSQTASASSLINDQACPVFAGEALASHELFYAARVSGFRCEDIRTLEKARGYAHLALMPASFAALRNPALGAELAAMGLTFANPAVLSVAVVGVVGVTTLNIILNASLEECDRLEKEEFRTALMQELETKYGLRAVQSQVPLEIQQ